MYDKKKIAIIAVQFVITAFLQVSIIYWLLLAVTCVNFIILAKVIKPEHEAYKICIYGFYIFVYSGTVIQMMSYLDDHMNNKVLDMMSIPVLIVLVYLLFNLFKELYRITIGYYNQ